MGFGLATVLPRTYESELNVRVGRANGQDVENVYALAKFLESEAFRAKLSAKVGQRLKRRSVTSAVVEGGVGDRRSVSYLDVRATGANAEAARGLADLVLVEILDRHRPLFDASLNEYEAYQDALRRQIDETRAEIGRMAATMERVRARPSVEAPAVLLLQGQVESRQTQLLQFTRELRDSRIALAVNTRPTEALAAPSLPERPVWPMRSLFTAAGALLALLIAAASVLVAGHRPRD